MRVFVADDDEFAIATTDRIVLLRIRYIVCSDSADNNGIDSTPAVGLLLNYSDTHTLVVVLCGLDTQR